MDCSNCKEKRPEPVSWVAYETAMEKADRDKRRWFAAWLITFVLLVGGVIFYFWHDAQYTDESWTYEATTDGGGNAVANGDGEVYIYGMGESDAHETNP